MKTCRTCGREVGNWKYCGFCGTKLVETDPNSQQTNSLLRQNTVFGEQAGKDISSSGSPRIVPAQYVDTAQPAEAVAAPFTPVPKAETTEAAPTPVTAKAAEAPVSDTGTADLASDVPSADNTILSTADPVVSESPAEAAAEPQAPPISNSIFEPKVTEIGAKGAVDIPTVEYSVMEKIPVSLESEIPVIINSEPAPEVAPLVDSHEEPLIADSEPEAAPVDNSESESPFDLGGFLNSAKSQTNIPEPDDTTDQDSAAAMFAIDDSPSDIAESADGSPLLNDEQPDDIFASANTESLTVPTDPAVDTTAESGGFSGVDFENIDASADGADPFEAEPVIEDTDPVIEENNAQAFVCEPPIADQNQWTQPQPQPVPADQTQWAQPQPQPVPAGQTQWAQPQPQPQPALVNQNYNNTPGVTRPNVTVSDIDPMFGSAPSFDIESIKASYKSNVSNSKNKNQKGLFNRKK